MPSKPQQRQQSCNAGAAPQRLNTSTPQSFNNYSITFILTISTLQRVSASTPQQYQQCNAAAITQHIDVKASKPQYPAPILKYSILNALPVPCRELTSRHQTSHAYNTLTIATPANLQCNATFCTCATCRHSLLCCSCLHSGNSNGAREHAHASACACTVMNGL